MTEPSATPQLVWTGPAGPGVFSRDTAAVVRELFALAEHDVLVSSYVVRSGRTVFESLAQRMIERPSLRVRLFLHVMRRTRDTRYASVILREFSDQFARDWPWPTRPMIYVDPRTLETDPDRCASWHAKCLVVDGQHALVTSANFTDHAQTRNVEAGVLVRDAAFAQQVAAQFDSLVDSQQLVRLGGW